VQPCCGDHLIPGRIAVGRLGKKTCSSHFVCNLPHLLCRICIQLEHFAYCCVVCFLRIVPGNIQICWENVRCRLRSRPFARKRHRMVFNCCRVVGTYFKYRGGSAVGSHKSCSCFCLRRYLLKCGHFVFVDRGASRAQRRLKLPVQNR